LTILLFRLLENEIQKLQRDTADKEKDLKLQIEELKKDSDRQQKLIGQVRVHRISLWFKSMLDIMLWKLINQVRVHLISLWFKTMLDIMLWKLISQVRVHLISLCFKTT